MAEPVYIHKFRYPIHELKPGETVLEKFPELATHDKFVTYGFGENDAYFRYAIYLGEGSGLHTAVADWGDRKKEAARLAGIKPKDPRYEAILALKDDAAQELRWEWMLITSSRLYRAYVVGCEVYDQTCRKSESPIPDATGETTDLKADAEVRTYRGRIDLWHDLMPLDEKLRDMEAKLFFGDEDMKRLAVEAARPAAKRGSLEDLVLGKKGK